MPEDIPESAVKLTKDDKLSRASDWSDYRKDYGVSSDERELGKQHSLFCAGWDEGFDHGKRVARKEATERAQAENDERLGRWRDSEHPDYVVKIDPLEARIAHVLHEPSLQTWVIPERDAQSAWPIASARAIAAQAAAQAYFAAHPAHPAWADAEVISWRTEDGFMPWLAQRSESAMPDDDRVWLSWHGDGGWRTEAEMVKLIGDAEVTVLVPATKVGE